MTAAPSPLSFATQLSDKLFIAPQPKLDAFHDLAAAGFKRVVSNRPDGEQPDQPSPAAEQQAAAAAGMTFHFIPVTATTITEADVRSFQKAVSESSGPVFAHCRSGVRSASLHAIGEVLDGRLAREDLPALGREWGVDLSIAAEWLAREHGGAASDACSSREHPACDMPSRLLQPVGATIDPVPLRREIGCGASVREAAARGRGLADCCPVATVS